MEIVGKRYQKFSRYLCKIAIIALLAFIIINAIAINQEYYVIRVILFVLWVSSFVESAILKVMSMIILMKQKGKSS